MRAKYDGDLDCFEKTSGCEETNQLPVRVACTLAKMAEWTCSTDSDSSHQFAETVSPFAHKGFDRRFNDGEALLAKLPELCSRNPEIAFVTGYSRASPMEKGVRRTTCITIYESVTPYVTHGMYHVLNQP